MNAVKDKCTLRQRDDTLHVISGDDLLSLCKWAETVKVTVTARLGRLAHTFTLIGRPPRRAKNLGSPKEHDLQSLVIYINKREEGGIQECNIEPFKSKYLT